jgi:hypothetical protein
VLDEDTKPAEASVEAAEPARPDAARKKQTRTAIWATTGVGVALAIVFFPAFFIGFELYDDEGAHLSIMKQFLQHGSLYNHTGAAYGPFLYSFVGAAYRLTGQLPNLTNGRFWVLGITVLETAVLGATVFKITRNVFCSVLCQVASFLLLAPVSGIQSLHPGPVLVLCLSVIAYALVSYSMDRRNVMLVVAGVGVGAMVLMKVNVGLLAATAIIAAWIVGNEKFSKTFQVLVGAGALIVPFVLVSQRIAQTPSVAFAALVSLSLLATGATAVVDRVSLSGRGLVKMLWGLLGVGVAAVIWPLLTGTSPTDLARGVLLAPLGQVDHLARPPDQAYLNYQWFFVLVTLVVAVAALTRRRSADEPKLFGSTVLPHLALALAGLWIFGLVLIGSFGSWLPLIAIVPALAWMSDAPPSTRLALRFLTPLAILQILHAYPVEGAQAAWGSALAFVPCSIAFATGLARLDAWRRLRTSARVLCLAALCAVLVLAYQPNVGEITTFWPVSLWRTYQKSTPIDLPGARLIRVSPSTAATLDALTTQIRKHCDTFYSAPGVDSLYFFTGIAPPTGMLRNWPGAHTAPEQQQIASQLAAAHAAGKRVCIVRNILTARSWLKSSYGKGPLGKALAPYNRGVAVVKPFTISVRGDAAGATAP